MNLNKINRKNEFASLFVLFTIWPFTAFFFAIKNFGHKHLRFFILLFFVFIGFTFIPRAGADSNDYLNYISIYSGRDFSFFSRQFLLSLIGRGLKGFEIYQDFSAFLITRFSNNPAFVFALTAMVYYFAWTNIVSKLYFDHKLRTSKNFLAFFFLVAFALYVTIFRAINARFYLAYWIFVSGAYKIIVDKNYRSFYITLLAVFIHQAYIFPNLILLIFVFSQRIYGVRNTIFFILVVLGHLSAEFGPTVINESLDLFGDTVEERYSKYIESGRLDADFERSWFLVIRGPMLLYSLLFLVFSFKLNKNIIFDKHGSDLYSFILLFWAASAFTMNIYMMGTRFRNVLIGFLLILVFRVCLINSFKKIPFQAWPSIVSFVFFKFITYRMNFEQVSAWIIAPFGPILSITDKELTLWQAISKLIGIG